MDKHLHIVTHDIPWPADYGGVVDLFYKIRSLHALGIKIHLHCYYSAARVKQTELLKYCDSVDYYPRKKNFSFRIPYIVQSRSDKGLLAKLQQDDHPVLLEGIHCTYLLKKGALDGRKVFVRLHNVEYKYYRQLAKHEINIFKKIYYSYEGFLLKKYERSIANKAVFWPVSTDDTKLYKKEFHAEKIAFLPVFLPWNEISTQPGKGCFCLYHGNLSVNENEKAADWLLNNVFNTLEIPFVIAGKNPSLPLQTLAHSHAHTCMAVNPSDVEMQDLIKKAQVNILPSFNKTGVKLKLLNALYNGRHCLVNNAGKEGAAIDGLCSIAETADDFKMMIKKLFQENFTAEALDKRQQMLQAMYDNEKNAKQLITWIY
ncbi:MAG: glycosyltransferase family 4 protein [Ferruginibacter sp.]